jgi:hypothetical protein
MLVVCLLLQQQQLMMAAAAAAAAARGAAAAAPRREQNNSIRKATDDNVCQTYHIDSHAGDDAATGCSPATAWRSLFRLRQQKLQAGNSVLLVRGGEWRGFLIGQGGNRTHPVTYGAYGDAALPKPMLMGSVSPKPCDWSQLGGSSVWAVNISALAAPVVEGSGIAGNEVTDVGNLVSVGRVRESKLGRKVWSAAELQENFDFFFDRTSKMLLLKSTLGNPSTVSAGSIECALMWLVCQERISSNRCAPPATLPSNALVASAHVSNIVFQDLALRYTAGTALGAFMVRSLTVHRCDIRWIGGGTRYIPETDPTCAEGKCVRFGNGIELWMGATDVDVAYNRVDQVYDAGLTNQGAHGDYLQNNISWHDNIVSHTQFCFEIWDDSPRNQSTMQDIRFENNSCTNSGGGWSQFVRPDKLSTHIKMGKTTGKVAHISIFGNRFSQSVPISASWSMFDSPWGDNTSWGWSVRTDANLWCQTNASLGPLLVIGCIPGPPRPCLRISVHDFDEYRMLSGNGATSHAIEGRCHIPRGGRQRQQQVGGVASGAAVEGGISPPPGSPGALSGGARLSGYTIRLAANASTEETYAATQLQTWGSVVAGTQLPIAVVPSDGTQQRLRAGVAPSLWVGYGAASTLGSSHGVPPTSLQGLGLEGSLVLAIGPTGSPSFVISGGPSAPRGAIYGATRFCELVLGWRFLAPNVTVNAVHANGSNPSLVSAAADTRLRDLEAATFVPPLEMRDINNAQSEGPGNEPWSVAVGDNGQEFGDTEKKVGGGVLYASPPGAVHTSFTLVPPSDFAKEHPEWYGGSQQLCWLAPGLKEFLAKRVPEILRGQPNASIISVSQNDNQDYCKTGPDLQAMQDEGSPAAPMLRAINYIADSIRAEFPTVAIDTLAYQYTRPAPNKTRPRPNVIVRLCSIECNFLRPLTHSSNAAFATDITNWNRISDRLYIWDYAVDFSHVSGRFHI